MPSLLYHNFHMSLRRYSIMYVDQSGRIVHTGDWTRNPWHLSPAIYRLSYLVTRRFRNMYGIYTLQSYKVRFNQTFCIGVLRVCSSLQYIDVSLRVSGNFSATITQMQLWHYWGYSMVDPMTLIKQEWTFSMSIFIFKFWNSTFYYH